ncbi:MAG: DUF6057 family protein [candidate division WOR-3 bacterium]
MPYNFGKPNLNLIIKLDFFLSPNKFKMIMKLKELIYNPNSFFIFFFLLIFFYFLIVFKPSLFYHLYQPIFLFQNTFLREFIMYPGGLSDWIAQFFSQFLYFNLVGSIIISILSLSIFIIIYNLIKKFGDFKYSLILSFFPIIFYLIGQNRYNFPFVISFKFFIALLFYSLYIKIPNRYRIFMILPSFLIYYFLGGWVFLFFVALSILHEILFSKERRKYINIIFNLIGCLLYPYIAAKFLFIITLKEAYFYIAPYEFYREPFLFKPGLYFYLFFLSLPILKIGLFVYLKYIKSKKRKQNKLLAKIPHSLLAQSIFIIFFGFLILYFSFEEEEKKKIQIDYLADKGKWKELLNISKSIKSYDRLVNFNVNRALYHKGELLDSLFDYPQLLGSDGLFIDRIIASQVAIPASDLYFDLGHINASQVMAYEAQTKFKYNPRVLKRLALTNIINENYVAAKKFLDLLYKSILHRKWAKYYKNYIFDKSLIEKDSLIKLKRMQRPDFDFFITNKTPNLDLIKLLKQDEKNKMAFEYLIAYYLLEGRLGDLLEYFDKFKNLGYKKLPRHIEEAILVIMIGAPSKINMKEWRISPETIEKFKLFNIAKIKSKRDKKAKEYLEKEFHNTYWYYLLYLNPKRTKLELRSKIADEDIL